MITRLPRWVWSGAAALAFVAGFVNAVGLLGFEHQAVSHVTGTTSLLATAAADGDFATALRLLYVLLSFLIGAVVSGIVIQDSTLQLGRRYGAALLMESALLFAAIPLLAGNGVTGIYLVSAACGLQNAMVTTYSGAIVRTTHMTGVLTDLGITLGEALRTKAFDKRRVELYVAILFGFLCGGAAGTMGFHRLAFTALLVPAGLTMAFAAGYMVTQTRGGGRA